MMCLSSKVIKLARLDLILNKIKEKIVLRTYITDTYIINNTLEIDLYDYEYRSVELLKDRLEDMGIQYKLTDHKKMICKIYRKNKELTDLIKQRIIDDVELYIKFNYKVRKIENDDRFNLLIDLQLLPKSYYTVLVKIMRDKYDLTGYVKYKPIEYKIRKKTHEELLAFLKENKK